MLKALPFLFEGDAEAAHPSFVAAGEIAELPRRVRRAMFARLGRGYSLILQERVAEGMALLDEVMVSVTADEVTPMLAGIALSTSSGIWFVEADPAPAFESRLGLRGAHR